MIGMDRCSRTGREARKGAPVKKWEGQEGDRRAGGEGRMEDTSNRRREPRGGEKEDPHFSWSLYVPAKGLSGNRSTSKGSSPTFCPGISQQR